MVFCEDGVVCTMWILHLSLLETSWNGSSNGQWPGKVLTKNFKWVRVKKFLLLFYFTFHYRNLLPHARCRTWNSPHGRSVHCPTWLCLLGSWLPREKRRRNMKAARLQPLYIAGRCSRACYKQHTITSFFIFLYRFLPRLKATQNRSCCTSDPLSWFCFCVFSVGANGRR